MGELPQCPTTIHSAMPHTEDRHMTDFEGSRVGRDLSALARAAENGRLIVIQGLLAAGADALEDSSRPLFLAARAGHADCVRALIPSSNVLASRGKALRVSAIHGRVDCARLLLPAMGGSEEALAIFALARQDATSRGHAELAELIRSVEERIALSSAIVQPQTARLRSRRV